ncbi:MAG: hypothetical protein JXA83_06000 [Acidimicrobiales bacterium]|nr:hypothetical protein [Acidimicrobiales bacterium]
MDYSQMTGTNTVTVYRSPSHPQTPWSLGIGFDEVLSVLESGPEAPLDAAEAALTAAGLRRVGDWQPHFPRAEWGWRIATVTAI